MPKIVIIGGGVGGSLTALKLQKAGWEVILIDKNEDILMGSSDVTPGRMGLGFHYVHFPTGKLYLESTIDFVKEFPGFRIGEDFSESHYLRNGRYFVAKDSHNSVDEIRETYTKLKQRYAELVKEDPRNKVFGEPEKFFRELDPKEYENDLNTKEVIAGFETREHLLDWKKFKNYIMGLIRKNTSIQILTNTEIKNIQYSNDAQGFILHATRKEREQVEINVDYVINATWENIELLNEKIGFYVPSEQYTNRLKVLAEVELPSELKEMNSAFICMGPFSMFSNTGNGYGLMSYAPVTSIETHTGLGLSPNMQKLLYSKPSDEKVQFYGNKIIEGVAKYIPAMSKAKLLNVRFGIVKTKGTVDIHASDSDFHKRDYNGVESRQIGWIDNGCMKLLYCADNAESVVKLLEQHKKAKGIAITEIPKAINDHGLEKSINTKQFEKIIIANVLKYISFENINKQDLSILTDEMTKVVHNKKSVLSNLDCFFQGPSRRSLVSNENGDWLEVKIVLNQLKNYHESFIPRSKIVTLLGISSNTSSLLSKLQCFFETDQRYIVFKQVKNQLEDIINNQFSRNLINKDQVVSLLETVISLRNQAQDLKKTSLMS